jgi:hypothetical protein
MTLQLRFSSSRAQQRQQPGRSPAAMKFQVSNLQQEACRQQFLGSLQNRFSVLADMPDEPEVEWQRFATAVQQTAASSLGQQQRKQQRRSYLSEGTLSTIHHKQVAFAAWQQRQQLCCCV